MAKWSLKNDNNQQNQSKAPDMPPELSNYYREEKRDRMWGAWALGFATLVVTIALGVGLFMGGRWLVGVLTDDGEVEQPTTTQTEIATDDSSNDFDGLASGDTSNQAAGNTDNDGTQEGGVVSDEAAVTENLPDTGPGDSLAIFLAVVVLGTVGHNLATKRS